MTQDRQIPFLAHFYLGAAITMLLSTVIGLIVGNQSLVACVDLIYGSLLLIRNICWPETLEGTIPYPLAVNYALGLAFLVLGVTGLTL